VGKYARSQFEADAGVAVAERLTKLGYQEIAEGEELRAGAYEFWSGEDENGSDWSGVHFIERPQDQGLYAKLLREFEASDD